MPISTWRSSTLALALLVAGGGVVQGQSAADVARLERELAAAGERLRAVEGGALVCPGDGPCPIRLFLAGRLTERLFDRALSGRRVTLRMYDRTGWLLRSGGGGAGCGYFVEVNGNDLNADLAFGSISPSWTTAGLRLRPAFRFVAWGSLHGHVHGPACPLTGCSCTIGGGAGTTVGFHAERDDSLPLLVGVANDAEGYATVALVQEAPKPFDVTVGIGLQNVGTLGIPISFVLPAARYFSVAAPRLLAQEGALTLPGGTVRSYRFRLAAQPVELSDLGFAARLLPEVEWTP